MHFACSTYNNNIYYELIIRELISWQVDFVRIDYTRIDLVGVDLMRIDLVGAPRQDTCSVDIDILRRFIHHIGQYKDSLNEDLLCWLTRSILLISYHTIT